MFFGDGAKRPTIAPNAVEPIDTRNSGTLAVWLSAELKIIMLPNTTAAIKTIPTINTIVKKTHLFSIGFSSLNIFKEINWVCH